MANKHQLCAVRGLLTCYALDVNLPPALHKHADELVAKAQLLKDGHKELWAAIDNLYSTILSNR